MLKTVILATIDMDVKCCLCRKAVTDASEKKWRKRLHGDSCREVKARLESISSVSLDSLLETSDPNAYLCRSCDSQIRSIDIFEAKLAVQKSAIKEKLSLLHSVVSAPLELLRKRSQPQPVAHKRLRLSEHSETVHAVQQISTNQDQSTTVVQPSPISAGQVEKPSPDVQVNILAFR